MVKQTTIAIVAIVLSVTTFTGVFFFGSNVRFEGEVAQLAILSTTDSGVQNCRIWNVMTEVGINNERRTYSPVTRTFDIFTTNELISASSLVGTIRIIDTSARVRCDLAISDTTFQLVGGQVTTSFYATQENGQETFIKKVTRNITTIPRDVVNRDSIIPTGTILADEIDAKLTSTKENYVTKIRAEITANMLFKSSRTGTTSLSGQGIVQGIITVKVHNEILDPPQPISNVVDLTSVTGGSAGTDTIDIAKEFSTIFIKVRGQLPQWSASEGVPNYDIFTPDGKLFAPNVLMNIAVLIDSRTNLFQFTDPSFSIGTSPQTGFWKVEMHSNQDIRKTDTGLPQIDTKVFKVINSAPKATVTCANGTIVASQDQCPEGEPAPTGLDSDGDGILDVDDQCPFEIGLARNNGCPEPPELPPASQATIDALLRGKIVNVGTLVYSDASKEVFVGSGGLTSTGNFQSQTGQVAPLQLTAIVDSQEKVISRIVYEVLYVFPTLNEARAVLLADSDISFTPTLFVSSVQEKSGSSVPQRGGIPNQGSLIQVNEQGFFGLSLGSITVQASEFELLSREFIGDGNAKPVNLIIDTFGGFSLTKSTLGVKETVRFDLVNAFVRFAGITINNEVNSGIKECPAGTSPDYDINGKIIACPETDPTTDQTCRTTLRPEGFSCRQSFIDQFCPTGINQCNEPDRDGDGIPDLLDTICPSLAEDGRGTEQQQNDGCPLGSEGGGDDPCATINTGACRPFFGGDGSTTGGGICTEIDPTLCNPEDVDITTLLIIGGIGLIIVGVIVFAIRRR